MLCALIRASRWIRRSSRLRARGTATLKSTVADAIIATLEPIQAD